MPADIRICAGCRERRVMRVALQRAAENDVVMLCRKCGNRLEQRGIIRRTDESRVTPQEER